MENPPFEDIFLFKMGIFHCYVSLPEGIGVLYQGSLNGTLFGGSKLYEKWRSTLDAPAIESLLNMSEPTSPISPTVEEDSDIVNGLFVEELERLVRSGLEGDRGLRPSPLILMSIDRTIMPLTAERWNERMVVVHVYGVDWTKLTWNPKSWRWMEDDFLSKWVICR